MAKLIVEVLNARDLLPTDHHGSASPFVEVDFNGRRQRTKTKIRDLYPTWNEKLVFDIENPRNLHNYNILVTLYDDHHANHQKEFLGSVQISGASVALLESEAAVRRYLLCKRGSFSHDRGDIALRIYTLRAQYFYGNQQSHRRLNIKKAPKLEEISVHDDKRSKGSNKRRDETRNSYSGGTIGGIIVHQNPRNTGSSVHFTPTLYYLRVGVIKARHLLPSDINRQPELYVKVTLHNRLLCLKTTTSGVFDGNPVWNEDLVLLASEEMLDEFIIVEAFDRIARFKDDLIGRAVVPMSGIPQRFDSTVQVEAQWFSLNSVSSNEEGHNKKKQGKILLRLCLEAGYHVSDGSLGDFQPSAKHMKKASIGTLELNILSARGLPLMNKQRDGGKNSTDAYCVAKYGNKWVRTRTIVNSQEPCWNEHYIWEVYDPCSVIRIGVFDNCNVYESKQDFKDMGIGKVFISIQTLEANRIHTHYYPLLVLHPSAGLKNHGELQVAVRFTTCVAWANMIAQYTKPVLPKMNYLLPFDWKEDDWLRHMALQVVVDSLTRAEPPFKKEIVEYILDPGSYLWGMRKHKADFERLMSSVLCITAVYRWFDEICHWRYPLKTIFIYFLYLVFVCYPKLILPAFFFSLSMTGLWNYRSRPRHPPRLDARLSQAEIIDADDLDEEFDTFPTSKRHEIVKMRYARLRSVAGRYQTMLGDIATGGEMARAILTCTDIRATSIFTAIAFFWVVFIYLSSFRVVATLLGLYWLRPPQLRSKTPSLLVNLFKRLPSKMDVMILT